MKFNKIAAGALALLALSSCSEGQYWDSPIADIEEVSFPKAAAQVDLLADDVFDSYEVVVTRGNTGAAQVIDLFSYTTAPEVFTAPATAEFAAGSAQTTVTIRVNTAAMTIGTKYNISLGSPSLQTVSVADSLLTGAPILTKVEHPAGTIDSPAANNKFTLTVSKNYTWQNIGWMLYTDGFVSTFYGVEDVTYYVPVQAPVQEEGKGVYRLVNPYGAYYPYNEPGDYSGTSYLEINASNPAQVYIPTPQEQGMNWGEGKFIMGSIAGLRLNNGWTADQITAEGTWGTLVDGEITFPAGALLVGMSAYNGGGLYRSNNGGGFCLDLNSLTTENPY